MGKILTSSHISTTKVHAKIIPKVLALCWKLRPKLTLLYGFGAASEIAGTLLSTYAGAQLINALISAAQGSVSKMVVWRWLVLSLFGILMINIGFWMMGYARRIIYYAASKWATLSFMNKLGSIDIASFYAADTRNLINKLESGYTWQVSNAVNNTLDFSYAVVRLVVIVGVLSTLAWWVSPLIALFLIPTLIIEVKTAKIGWFVWDEKGDERHIFWGISYMVARVKHQYEIRSMGAKPRLIGVIDAMITRFQSKQIAIYKKANPWTGLAKVVEIIGTALAEMWLIYRILYQKNLSIGSFLFYTSAIGRISGSLNTVVSSYSGMQEQLLFTNDFYRFMELPTTIVSKPDAVLLDTKKIPTITFKDVWFKYPETETWVLKGLNLSFAAGEHVALVGENGAGKTTIIKLLLRFYDVEKGSIELDGVNIKDVSLDSWYEKLGTLFQEFNQYPLSVEDNIAIGKAGKTDPKALRNALKQSGVDKLESGFPFGLQTVLDSSFKKGLEPSGGQWQRVALARAFYRQAQILVLDEPTSAIDAKAEYHIFNEIFDHYKDKTAIIVSHRFSTVRRAHRIIVLDHGKVLEEGSHEKLIKQDGLYKEMFEKQAAGYR